MVSEKVVTGGTEAVTANPPGDDTTAAACTSRELHPNLNAPSLAHGKASSDTTKAMAETISRYTAELDSNSVKKARPSGGGGKSKLKTGKPKEGRSKGTTYLTPSTAKGKTSAYAKFRQSHALGRFAVLAETEEEDAVSLEDDDTDDAPYAYPPHMEAILNPEPEPATATVDGDESGYQSTEAPAAGLQQGADVDEEMLSAEEAMLSSYVGSSAPSRTQSPASIPGSEFPYSLQSDGDVDSTPREGDNTQTSRDDEATMNSGVVDPKAAQAGDPSLSQDGFSLGPTRAAPGMPLIAIAPRKEPRRKIQAPIPTVYPGESLWV
ncbi:hypothetical protein PF004_g19988 [Phytophthora fragariae]|uniref:Uncharacterized protein n=1 Tax=Phytophthora fragariae TaxID=53985 RepID=A0A6G0N965_9STRA|nr:hypothetical protein PF004_g19988 [Phytophthora fragariae]